MTQTEHRVKWDVEELAKIKRWMEDNNDKRPTTLTLQDWINRAQVAVLPINRRRDIKNYSMAMTVLRRMNGQHSRGGTFAREKLATIHPMPAVPVFVPKQEAPPKPAPAAPVAVEMTRATLLAMLPHIPKGSLIQLTD